MFIVSLFIVFIISNMYPAVNIAKPFEGATLISTYSGSDKKELYDEFLKFIVSNEFQRINVEKHNQVPTSSIEAKGFTEYFTSEKFGGQNLMKIYDEINNGVVI